MTKTVDHLPESQVDWGLVQAEMNLRFAIRVAAAYGLDVAEIAAETMYGKLEEA